MSAQGGMRTPGMQARTGRGLAGQIGQKHPGRQLRADPFSATTCTPASALG